MRQWVLSVPFPLCLLPTSIWKRLTPGTSVVVAVTQEHRGRGIDKRLMQTAREQAQDHGYDRLSLVVFEENMVAVRLYQHLGYEIIKRAPVVQHPLIRCRGDTLLMVAPVS